jgi:hypothetical protein
MVYTPRAYLVSAAVALVAVQMHQTGATSLFYDPVTVSGTTDEISGKFPARGAEVADQDCAITVEVDPTLPNITTISIVPVTYPGLLANTSTAPSEPVFTKVGTAVVSEPVPSTDADQDAYIGTGSTPSTSTTVPASKTGTTTVTAAPTKTGTTTTSDTVQGEADKDEPNCATGWEETKPARKLRDSAVSGHELEEQLHTKRQLEANTNKDIAKLEAYFGTPMEMTLKNLPKEGVHTPSPWPGPYWPTYQDGINVAWNQGEPSPAEKYATAFGLDVTDFMDKVSKDTGIDSMSSRTKCSSDNDCSSLTDGSACAIRAGKSSGYCIPTWYGICHAWTPAAMLEAEPNCPVTHNGVTFQPMDLKALISDIYDGASVSTVFTGTRFNGGSDSTDEYGRHSSAAYRDLNPAYFHITAANLLGKLNATFIADVTAGSEVWNQPVRGFKVYEQTEMSLEEAAQTFYGLEKYPWNAAAKSIVYIKSRLSWIYETYTDGGLVSSGQVDKFTTGAYYTYLLEMDDEGAIIGGEWVYDSDEDHPDFIWFPKSKPAADTVTSVGLSYADVSMLMEKSAACSDSSAASSGGSESSGSAGSESSSSATSSTSSSASVGAPTSGSSASSSTSSVSGSPSASSEGVTTAPTTGSGVGSNTAAPAETPAATYATAGSSTTTTIPATGGSQGVNQDDGDNNNDNHHDGQRSQRQHQSYFHWW